MIRRLQGWLQHWSNELHVYCRLKDCGVSTDAAKRWSRHIVGWLKPLAYKKEN